MKKLAIAVAVITIIGTPASAADIAVKAAAPSPAAVYNWTGWYVGVNAGASMGNAKTDFNVAHSTVNVFSPPGTFLGSVAVPRSNFAGSDTEAPSEFVGGGQIGYNYQLSPIWVVGFEADFQGALEKDSSTISQPFSFATPFGVLTGSTVLDYQTKIDWFGTVRARLGYVWGNGDVMSYVTGGLAYGKVDLEGTSTIGNEAGSGGVPFFGTQAIGHSQVNTGWVVGYGTEGVIDFWGARNWTWKIEGLYMDLGTLDATGGGSSNTRFTTIPGQPLVAAVTTAGQVTTHSHFTDGILRAGLNYKFY